MIADLGGDAGRRNEFMMALLTNSAAAPSCLRKVFLRMLRTRFADLDLPQQFGLAVGIRRNLQIKSRKLWGKTPIESDLAYARPFDIPFRANSAATISSTTRSKPLVVIVHIYKENTPIGAMKADDVGRSERHPPQSSI